MNQWKAAIRELGRRTTPTPTRAAPAIVVTTWAKVAKDVGSPVAPAGVEVALPAIEFLAEKSIRGSYYGSADPAETMAGLVELVRAGRLELADVVSHLISLDEVEDALGRLRRGEGDRSVIVVAPELAGVEAGSPV